MTKVIEDFDRAVNVEALRRIKETGEHVFLVTVHSHQLHCRAGTFVGTARICQDQLPSGFPLHGRHPRIPPQPSHKLGDQRTRAGGEQYILDLRLARDRENVVSSFNLCDSSQGKSPCWRIFLPEGRREFERAQKSPAHSHPQARRNLPPFSERCCRTSS